MANRYNVVIAEQQGEGNNSRTIWHRVGTAFPMKNKDGFRVLIPQGVSISGEVLLFAAQDKAPGDEG